MEVKDYHEPLTCEHVDVASESSDVVLSRVLWFDSVYAKPAVFVHGDPDCVSLPGFEAVHQRLVVWIFKDGVALDTGILCPSMV